MNIDLCNKLVDNNLSRNELLERIEIRKTSIEDFSEICATLAKAFNLSSPLEAAFQIINSNALLNESIKLVDKETNEIYGLLIFMDWAIQKGSPIEFAENNLSKYLSPYKQINGHSFVIDKRLRNCGIDKKMLYFNSEFLLNNYDFIWIGVEKTLRSKNYWKRLGFTEVFTIPEASFYLLPLNKKIINDIYNI